MRRAREFGVEPDVVMYSLLSKAYLNANDVSECQSLLPPGRTTTREVKARDKISTPLIESDGGAAPTTSSANQMRLQAAITVIFEEMVRAGKEESHASKKVTRKGVGMDHKPDSASINLLLTACREARLPRLASRILLRAMRVSARYVRERMKTGRSGARGRGGGRGRRGERKVDKAVVGEEMEVGGRGEERDEDVVLPIPLLVAAGESEETILTGIRRARTVSMAAEEAASVAASTTLFLLRGRKDRRENNTTDDREDGDREKGSTTTTTTKDNIIISNNNNNNNNNHNHNHNKRRGSGRRTYREALFSCVNGASFALVADGFAALGDLESAVRILASLDWLQAWTSVREAETITEEGGTEGEEGRGRGGRWRGAGRRGRSSAKKKEKGINHYQAPTAPALLFNILIKACARCRCKRKKGGRCQCLPCHCARPKAAQRLWSEMRRRGIEVRVGERGREREERREKREEREEREREEREEREREEREERERETRHR